MRLLKRRALFLKGQKMKKNSLFLSLLMLVMISLSPATSFASEFNFAVTTEIPGNQIDKSKTYFNLLVNPGEKQTLSIKLRNDTDKDVVIEPQIHSATTNMNGVVEYGKTDSNPDKSLKYNLADILTTTKEVTIPAKSEKKLEMKLSAPTDEFEGLIAGGITLIEKQSEADKKNSKSEGLSIENKYAYVVGVTLQQNKTEVNQDLKLNGVKAGQVNARNAILAELQNPTPTYLNQFEIIEAKVTKKGETKTLFETDKQHMQVAPNTNFKFPIPLDGASLESGKYTLHLKAKSSKEAWEFSEDFEIKANEAKAFNEKDVSIPEKEMNYLLVIIIGIVLLVLALFIIILLKRKKDDKNKGSGSE